MYASTPKAARVEETGKPALETAGRPALARLQHGARGPIAVELLDEHREHFCSPPSPGQKGLRLAAAAIRLRLLSNVVDGGCRTQINAFPLSFFCNCSFFCPSSPASPTFPFLSLLRRHASLDFLLLSLASGSTPPLSSVHLHFPQVSC